MSKRQTKSPARSRRSAAPNYTHRAREIIELEIAGLQKVAKGLGNSFGAAVELILQSSTVGGKVVVSSDGPIEGLQASCGDLTAAGGKGTIPASAIEVRYAEPYEPDKTWPEPLSPAAPAKIAPAPRTIQV